MKRYLLLIAVIFCGMASFAQRNKGEDGLEKVQALKIAFITQKLDITTKEAQSFWPVYNQYESEVKKVARENDGDVIKNEEKLLNTRKKYKPQFDKILGAERANELFNVEREFRKVLIKRLKNRGNR